MPSGRVKGADVGRSGSLDPLSAKGGAPPHRAFRPRPSTGHGRTGWQPLSTRTTTLDYLETFRPLRRTRSVLRERSVALEVFPAYFFPWDEAVMLLGDDGHAFTRVRKIEKRD